MRFLPVNLDALLVELDDLAQTLALHASLAACLPNGVRELVCGARTILVRFDPARTDAQAVVDAVAHRRLDGAVRHAGTRIEIPVHYDGEDLDDVAGLLGMSRQELIARHTGTDYCAAFSGFAPGFVYLSGGDPLLNVPRRSSPRTRVPAGAVALAGQFSAVYPQQSPGGWQLLGVTPLAMWDMQRHPPAVVQPGDRVRFVDAARLTQTQIDALCAAGQRGQDRAPADKTETLANVAAPAMRAQRCVASLHVLAGGLLTLFQDAGRHGKTALGVCACGAADQGALRAANRLVGNDPGQACLEVTQGGLILAAHGNATLAVTGADVEITVRSASGQRWCVTRGQAFALGDGDTLSLGQARAGVRAYVAVRGGFDEGADNGVAHDVNGGSGDTCQRVFCSVPVLGSRSTDTLARLGPPPVQRGDILRVRTQSFGPPVDHPIDPVALADKPLPRANHCVTLDVIMGPRTDWFTPDAIARFCDQQWRVTPQSNRVGLRLTGQAIVRTQAAQAMELPSEGTSPGSIQIPPNGQPVLFLNDHPLTGGYPVIATVANYHLDLAGQIPVDARIRFRALRAFSPILPTQLA